MTDLTLVCAQNLTAFNNYLDAQEHAVVRFYYPENQHWGTYGGYARKLADLTDGELACYAFTQSREFVQVAFYALGDRMRYLRIEADGKIVEYTSETLATSFEAGFEIR